MQESLQAYMRVGLIHFMAYPETIKGEGAIAESIRKIAADDYFDAVELSWIKDSAEREKVRGLLASSHLSVAYGAQPRLLTQKLNINDLDPAGRIRALDTIKEGIDEAYEIGAAGLAFLSGPYEESTKDESYRMLLKSTREICAYAASKGGLQIVHEVFDYDVDKRSLIGPAELAQRYAEDIKKEFDNFGLMVDLSHLPLLRETPEEAILPIREHLVHAHIGNCVVKDPDLPGYGDQHPRFGFLGGENDVPELVQYLQVLKDTGFLNKENPPIVSMEIKPMPGEDPEVVIAGSKRVLNRAWSLVT